MLPVWLIRAAASSNNGPRSGGRLKERRFHSIAEHKRTAFKRRSLKLKGGYAPDERLSEERTSLITFGCKASV